MSYVQLEVTRTNLSGVETDITYDIEQVTVRRGMDQKANTVQVVLKNAYVSNDRHRWVSEDNQLVWEEDEGITIKCKYNEDGTALSDDDILTIADALEFNAKMEDDRTPLTIKAVDKTFNLLNQQIPQAITLADGLTSGEIIQKIIQLATYNQDGSGTFSVTANLQVEATYDLQKDSATPGIQTKRINDTNFPIISMAKVYKPVYEWIDDLSTIEATNNFDGRDSSLATDDEESPVQNRKMKYYVDKDNNFRWFYPDNDIDYTITIGAVSSGNDDVKSYNLTKTTFDVINFVIYNGGMDMYGVGTLNYYFDETTKSKKLLTKYKAYNDIALVLIQNEINSGNLVGNTSGAFTFQGNRYENDTYGFETSWGVDTTGFSDDDYNDSLRAEIDRRCKQRARAFTARRGNPRWKGSIVLNGRNLLPGETILLTSYVHGINNQILRITDITHVITRSVWQATLQVEEDDPIVGTT